MRKLLTATMLLVLFVTLIVAYSVHINTGSTNRKQVLETSPNVDTYHLGDWIDIMEDSTNILGIDEISSSKMTQQFHPNNSTEVKLSYSSSNLWIKFTMKPHNLDLNDYIIVFDDWGLSTVRCYIPDKNGRFTTKIAGIDHPYASREIKGRSISFDLGNPTTASTYYFCINAPLSSVNLSIMLKSEKAYYSSLIKDTLFVGILIGLLLLLSLLSAGVYLGTKEMSYIYFSFNVLIMTIWFADTIGLVNELLGNQIQLLMHNNVGWILGISGITSSLFAMDFLETRRNSRFVHSLYRVTIVVITLLMIGTVVMPFQIKMLHLSLSGIVINLVNIIAPLFLIMHKKLNSQHLRVFLVSQIILLIGIILLVLCMFGLIPNNLFTHYSYYISIVLQFATIGYGLINRINRSNQELETVVGNRTIELREALNDLTQTQLDLIESKADLSQLLDKVVALVDNSGEGFLTFGASLIIDPECSRECSIIFSKDIAGISILDILTCEEDVTVDDYRMAFEMIFKTTDVYRREVLISLLPQQLVIGPKTIRLKYKPLDGAKLMMILTDITYEKQLESRIYDEQQRLRLIVTSITNRSEFMDILSSMKRFRRTTLPNLIAKTISGPERYSHVYRYIHTLKGTASQLNFLHLPHQLHQLETSLTENKNTIIQTPELLYELVEKSKIYPALDNDTKIITSTIGYDFIEEEKNLLLDKEQIANLNKVRQLLTEKSSTDIVLEQAVQLLHTLGYTGIKSMLEIYPKYATELATKLGKLVSPFEIEGQDFKIDPERYKRFLKSLIHVFRNAVDHGIESPDQRLNAEKGEQGTLHCTVMRTDNTFSIIIRDDGRGIDVEKIKRKAIEKGLISADEIANLETSALQQMIFLDEFSTKDEITELSGRGFGLNAVKKELDSLDGTVEIESTLGSGTCFTFHLRD